MGGANSSDALGREGRVGGGRHSNTAHPTGYQWLAISPVPPLPLVSSACVRLDSAALISLSCRKLPPPGGGGEREREREGGGEGGGEALPPALPIRSCRSCLWVAESRPAALTHRCNHTSASMLECRQHQHSRGSWSEAAGGRGDCSPSTARPAMHPGGLVQPCMWYACKRCCSEDSLLLPQGGIQAWSPT